MKGKFMTVRKIVLPTLVLLALATQLSGDTHITADDALSIITQPAVAIEMVVGIPEAHAEELPFATVPTVTGTQDFTDYSQDLGYGALNTHWGLNDINYMVSLGALKGVPNSLGGYSFEANRTITRSEFATILLRLLDPTGEKTQEALTNTDSENGDTLADMQAKGFTWEAETLTIVNWYGGTLMAEPTPDEWNKNITRDEMAFLTISLAESIDNIEFSKLTGIEKVVTDNNVVKNNPWSVAIYKAYSNGIIVGDEQGNFNPANNATRAEACAILSRLTDPTRRKEVTIPSSTPSTSSKPSQGTGIQTTTLYQSDPYRRSVQEGDIFVDNNGVSWEVKKDPVSGTFNPADPVGFDLGRIDSRGWAVVVGNDCDGTTGGVLGDIMIEGPNGHIAWRSEWSKILNSGWDEPTQPGTYDGELSPQKLYKWDAVINQWVFQVNL